MPSSKTPEEAKAAVETARADMQAAEKLIVSLKQKIKDLSDAGDGEPNTLELVLLKVRMDYCMIIWVVTCASPRIWEVLVPPAIPSLFADFCVWRCLLTGSSRRKPADLAPLRRTLQRYLFVQCNTVRNWLPGKKRLC